MNSEPRLPASPGMGNCAKVAASLSACTSTTDVSLAADPDPQPAHEAESLQALLAASAAGDRAAFARLYQLSSPRLYGLALHLLKRRDWADEALQEAYLQIWQRAATYSAEKGEPMAWLMGILRFRALDRLRRQARETSLEGHGRYATESMTAWPHTNPASLPYQKAETGSDLRRVQTCLQQLDSQQRECILMAYYQGYVHAELATHFQRPVGTIKSWIRRGLVLLRNCLDHEEKPPVQTARS